jgi:hypothetical protein
VPSPPIAPVSGATIPSSASLTAWMPPAASSCAVLCSRNAAVRPTTLDFALLNWPATDSSRPRSTPAASPPPRMSVASFLVSAPNAFRSACASANCARNAEVSAVTETERLSAITHS